MYELKPTGTLSWSYGITRDGAPVGMLDLKRFRAGGELTIADRGYELRRDGVFGALRLLDGERIIAEAKRAALLRPNYHILAEDRQLELKSRGFLMRTAELLHGDMVIAGIRRENFLKRTVNVTDSGNTPPPILMLCATVLILFWRQQSRSSK